MPYPEYKNLVLDVKQACHIMKPIQNLLPIRFFSCSMTRKDNEKNHNNEVIPSELRRRKNSEIRKAVLFVFNKI